MQNLLLVFSIPALQYLAFFLLFCDAKCVKKNLVTSVWIIVCALLILIKAPLINPVAAAEGDTCDPNAPTCDTGQSCVDPYGEGTRFECRTPVLPGGSACDPKNDRCPVDQICSPDAKDSTTGTCKAPADGALCDPSNPNACGSYVTSPYTCDPDPDSPTYSTCQSVSCNLKFGSDDCYRTNYYCQENPKGSGKGMCMFSTNPPDVTPAPGPPCAATGTVSVDEIGKDGKPTGKKITGETCASFHTALGTFSTDAAGFIKTGFGIVLSATGAIALLLIIRAGYKIMTSQGKPEAIQEGRDQLIAAIVGLLFLIFAFVFLEVIGVDILRIPGAGSQAGSTPNSLLKGESCIVGERTCSGSLNCFTKTPSTQKKGEQGTCQ